MFNKSKQNKKASALLTEISSITKQFTTMVDNLTHKAEEAEAIKKSTEEEIATLQQECVELQGVSDRARGLANKISGWIS
jgi:flagellar hook-associated protein FlgK